MLSQGAVPIWVAVTSRGVIRDIIAGTVVRLVLEKVEPQPPFFSDDCGIPII
jgi:hypothetical protein